MSLGSLPPPLALRRYLNAPPKRAFPVKRGLELLRESPGRCEGKKWPSRCHGGTAG